MISRSLRHLPVLLALLAPGLFSATATAAQIASADLYQVVDIPFTGPTQSPTDTPSNIDFWIRIQSAADGTTYKLYGFWDGDGLGGTTGSVFKVRFAGTRSGTWTIIETNAPSTSLHDQHEGDTIAVSATAANPGFWTPDPSSANGRWYRRSDDSHPYIIGTTYYDFLHNPGDAQSSAATVLADINATATRFNKVRFGLASPNTSNDGSALQPFFTPSGAPYEHETDRPNPAFFRDRVDVAVQRGAELNLICDLILEMGADPTTVQLATNPRYLKYVAARYGAYANVWFCIGNESSEFNTPAAVNSAGATLASYLAYPSPLSVHNVRGWVSGYVGTWYDHTINQHKLDQHLPAGQGNLAGQADRQISEYNLTNARRPVINDECAYDPGEATELQSIESALGCLLGGAYSSTGNKINGSKSSPYFHGYAARGIYTLDDHASSDNLGWARPLIDQYLTLENLTPSTPAIFSTLPAQFRSLAWDGNQYVLGSNSAASLSATLPTGTWVVRQLDWVAKTDTQLSASASGTFAFTTPASKATVTIFTLVTGGTAPSAPTGLSLDSANTTSLALSWTDTSNNETAFRLERSPDGTSDWTLRATPAANTTTTTDTGLNPGTTYHYRVRAENATGPSDFTAVLAATTLAANTTQITAPAPGTTFSPLQTVTLTGEGLDLAWTLTGAITTTGTGPSITFTLPINAVNGTTVQASLTGQVGTSSRTWTVLDTTPEITTTSTELAPATIGQAYSDDLEATGEEGPVLISYDSGTLPPGMTVTGNQLTGTPTTAGTYTFSLIATDADGDVSPLQSFTLTVHPPTPAFLETGGLVVFEAEEPTRVNPRADVNPWRADTASAGFSGAGYMQAPNLDVANGTWATASELAYRIQFQTTGTYTIWIRRRITGTGSNSAFIGSNDTQLGGNLDDVDSNRSAWAWIKHTATLVVAAPCEIELSLRRREDGYAVDRILLTTDTAYTPTSTGPTASATLGGAGPGYDVWSLAITDPAQRARTASVMGDGRPNFYHYALGGTPASPAPGLQAEFPDPEFQITFHRTAFDMIYQVEASDDLSLWETIATNPGTVGEDVTVTAPVNQRFLRVRLSLP